MTEILKSGNFGQILLQWILTYIQQRIGAETGVKPGSEMLAAIEEARAHQKPVAFIDRDIRITLSRFWGLMGIREKIRLIWALLYSLVSVDTQEIEIDELTDQDVVSVAMEEFRKFSPRGAQALIDERDAYLAHQILMLARRYDRVLAVIGAGHIKGVQRYLDAPETLPLLSDLTAEVKKGLPWAKILGAGVTILFLLLIAAIAFSGVGLDVLLTAIIYWILINGLLSAAFTFIAGGHPLSAATAFAVSMDDLAQPAACGGMVCGYRRGEDKETRLRRDQAIMEAETFSEMRRIPIPVVLVAALANVGSSIGTFAYFIFIFPVLGIDPAMVIGDGFSNMLQAIAGLL